MIVKAVFTVFVFLVQLFITQSVPVNNNTPLGTRKTVEDTGGPRKIFLFFKNLLIYRQNVFFRRLWIKRDKNLNNIDNIEGILKEK